MNKKIQYNKIKTVLINGKKKCIYMKPRGTREYVRHNKEFILLNRYLKLISKKLKKQKGGFFGRCFGNERSCKSKSTTQHTDDRQITFSADLVFKQPVSISANRNQLLVFEPPVSISAKAPTVNIPTVNILTGNDIGWREFDYKKHDKYYTSYVGSRLSGIDTERRERKAAISTYAAIHRVKGDFDNDNRLKELKADYDKDSTVQYEMYWRRINGNIEYGYVPINKFFGPMNVKVNRDIIYEKCYWIYYKASYNDNPTWRLFIELEPDEAKDPELKCDDYRNCMYDIPPDLYASSMEILPNKYLDDIINLSKEKYPFFNEYIQKKKYKFNEIVKSEIVKSMIYGR